MIIGTQRSAGLLCAFGLIVGMAYPAIGADAPSAAPGAEKSQKAEKAAVEPELMEFSTPDFDLALTKESQTVAALRPKAGQGFDFTPADRQEARKGNGFYHLGDLTMRVRPVGSSGWQDCSTAAARAPVRALPAGDALASADLTPTLPADCPVQVTRTWSLEGGRLALHFAVTNRSAGTVEIGALGIPMVFNNIISGRTLAEAHAVCSFSDPYIGQDGGYLQVTRLSGQGPTLVVVPESKTPFEAYQLLPEPMYPSQTFEGMFNWMVHSRAYADAEWQHAVPWNPPTAETLAPGATRVYGVKFLVSPEIRGIDKTLIADGRPVAIGVPGYILPTDLNGRLFLRSRQRVAAVTVEPAGAITVVPDKSTRGNYSAFTLHGKHWGRARLTLTYTNGSRQSISYYVIKPTANAVADMGHFLTTKQWFVNPTDPFHRSPSVISYDRETNRQLTQESRAWIAGLSDEAGNGSWLAMAMKEYGQPDPTEVGKLEQFVDGVLWGGLQYKDGPNQFGVRKSLFFHDPKALPDFPYDPAIDWGSWTSWNKGSSEDIGRGYNYPPVVAAYWSLYRLARNHPGLVKNHPWEWYLNQAYETVQFLTERNADGNPRVWYVDTGLMEGDVFVALLKDLKREGWTEKAAKIESRMKARADHWKTEAYPFGSEMAWDSTGQEEVYAWCHYFGYDDKAKVTLDSVLGYMPTLPHWGYNGNARRYWDFLYGGKLSRIERQIHHYGSGINALPVLAAYRSNPDDFYLLRVGYGGLMGPLSNIDQDGFASAAFHSFPSTLRWDAYSGDYGPNFFGHAMNAATYIVNHPELGWLAYGGNVLQEGDWVRVQPLDSFRQRVYVAPRGLWLTLDAGTFERIEVNRRTHTVRVGLSPRTAYTPQGLLRVEQPSHPAGVGTYHVKKSSAQERGAYPVTLTAGITWVEVTDTP